MCVVGTVSIMETGLSKITNLVAFLDQYGSRRAARWLSWRVCFPAKTSINWNFDQSYLRMSWRRNFSSDIYREEKGYQTSPLHFHSSNAVANKPNSFFYTTIFAYKITNDQSIPDTESNKNTINVSIGDKRSFEMIYCNLHMILFKRAHTQLVEFV